MALRNPEHPLSATLPHRLDAHGTLGMTGRILAAAEGEHLVPFLSSALRRVQQAAAALDEALRDRPAAPIVNDEARRADLAVDAAWGAFHEAIAAWARLPLPDARADQATDLLASHFPDGLAFTQLTYAAEWSVSKTRLAKIDKDATAIVAALGLNPFLDQVRQTHATYGKVLGITEAQAAGGNESSNISVPLNTLRKALRDYALKVIAHVDPDHPGSAPLAQRLLAPIEAERQREAALHPASKKATAPTTPNAAG